MSANGILVFPSEACRLQILDSTIPGADGNGWVDLPGVSSYRETGGEAPSREVVAFEAAASITGRRRPPTIECDVAAYNPHLPVWRKARDIADNATLASFRFRSKAAILIKPPSEAKISITTAGVITITGEGAPDLSEPEYAPGVVIRVGTDNYILVDKRPGRDNDNNDFDEIRVVDASTGAYPNAAVPPSGDPPTMGNVVRPAMIRGPFAAKIGVIDRGQMASESNLVSAIRIQPSAELPKWKFDVDDED